MENSTAKNNFKSKKSKIISKLKEFVTNELNTIISSLIISLLITITVCMPVSKFMFKDNSSMYGIVYESLTTLKYRIAPLFIIATSSLLVGYIFNKDYIKKIYFINNCADKKIYTYSNFLSRVACLLVMLVVVFIILREHLKTDIIDEEGALKYLYGWAITYGVLLTPISSLILFFGLDSMHSKVIKNLKKIEEDEKRKEEEEKRKNIDNEFTLKYEKLNKRYLSLFRNLINNHHIDYDNNNLNELLNINKDRDYGVCLVRSKRSLVYDKTKKYIEYNTNEGKYFSFSNQIKNIQKKYGSFNTSSIAKHFKKRLNIEDYSASLNYIDRIKDISSTGIFMRNEVLGYLRKVDDYLAYRVDIANDIERYIDYMENYLNKAHRNAERGYLGEQKVKKELDKYKDQFINIENKCFNFKYIDFINEDYTMECDNIVITQRGIFVIETKNNYEDSIYIDNNTGKAYDKCILHIESDGRWTFKENNAGFRLLTKTPIEQNRDHVLKLEKIINHNLGYDRFDDNYIEVKSIIVMASDTLKIINDFDGPVDICKVNSIYETITKYEKNPLFNREMIDKIVNIVNSYDNTIHKPNLYSAVNVEKELDYLYDSLDNALKNELSYNKINDLIKSYYEELYDLQNQYKKRVYHM